MKPMATISTNDILRLVLTFTMPEGTVAQNIYHYVVDSLTDPDSANVASDFLARFIAIYNHITPIMNDEVVGQTQEMYVRDEGAGEWTLVETDILVPIAGQSGIDMLPHGNAALVSALSTNNRTTGKKYLMGITEGEQQQGRWVASTVTALGLFAAGYADDFAGAAGAYTPGLWSEGILAFVPFIGGAQVNDIVAYQRRRKIGVGI